jgi:acetyl-CoA C-acetyltransferase
VYAARPSPAGLLLGDLAAEADRATPRIEVIAGYRGPARVAAYTVTYGQEAEPSRCIIIADTPSGARCMASSDDAALARRATLEELIGTTADIDGTRFTV